MAINETDVARSCEIRGQHGEHARPVFAWLREPAPPTCCGCSSSKRAARGPAWRLGNGALSRNSLICVDHGERLALLDGLLVPVGGGVDIRNEQMVQYHPERGHWDHRAIRLDLYIARLQIAVDDALFMRGFERVGNLARDHES